MALRQTTGFVEGLFGLIGLDWDVPDFSTLSRRRKTVAVNIPHRTSQGPLHLLIDSTSIKVEGEGEWNARKHGGPRRRVWRKVHSGIDEATLEIRAFEVTSSDIGDAPMLPELLSQIPSDQEVVGVTADGACDTRKCNDAIAELGAHAVIPPHKNAKPWKADSAGAGRAQQGAAGVEIPRPRALAMMQRRPPPEPRRDEDATSVKLPGQRLRARDFDRQVVAFQVCIAVLNGFTALGISVTNVAE